MLKYKLRQSFRHSHTYVEKIGESSIKYLERNQIETFTHGCTHINAHTHTHTHTHAHTHSLYNWHATDIRYRYYSEFWRNNTMSLLWKLLLCSGSSTNSCENGEITIKVKAK